MPPQFQNSQTAPSDTTETNFQKNTRGYSFLITLTILMLISGAYAIWYSYNLPPETESENVVVVNRDEFADWKTYRNDDYGFEFKYPSNLYYKEFSDVLFGEKRLKLNFFNSTSDKYSEFSFRINDVFGLEGCDKEPIKETRFINGVNFIRNDLCGQVFYEFDKNNNKFYSINWNYDVTLFDQVISTFMFIN